LLVTPLQVYRQRLVVTRRDLPADRYRARSRIGDVGRVQVWRDPRQAELFDLGVRVPAIDIVCAVHGDVQAMTVADCTILLVYNPQHRHSSLSARHQRFELLEAHLDDRKTLLGFAH
jgi:hypothetical protein